MRAEHLRKGDSVPYTQIANELLNFKNLSFKAKGIYAYLYSKPTDWDFAANRIALDGLDGREAILSGLKELIDAGYLTRRKMPDGRMEYEIWVHPKSEEPTLEPESANPTVAKPHGGEMPPISNKEETSNKDFDITKTFEHFWKLYPRKVSKTGAARAFASAFKRNKSIEPSELYSTIAGALAKQCLQSQWTKDGGKFIPHAMTWLNQERWNDEIDLEKEKEVEEKKKVAYIDGDRAYQKDGKWMLILKDGRHVGYGGLNSPNVVWK